MAARAGVRRTAPFQEPPSLIRGMSDVKKMGLAETIRASILQRSFPAVRGGARALTRRSTRPHFHGAFPHLIAGPASWQCGAGCLFRLQIPYHDKSLAAQAR